MSIFLSDNVEKKQLFGRGLNSVLKKLQFAVLLVGLAVTGAACLYQFQNINGQQDELFELSLSDREMAYGDDLLAHQEEFNSELKSLIFDQTLYARLVQKVNSLSNSVLLLLFKIACIGTSLTLLIFYYIGVILHLMKKTDQRDAGCGSALMVRCYL